jgi:hypothetical protein
MVYGKTNFTSHHSRVSHAAPPHSIPAVPPAVADEPEMAKSEENTPPDVDEKPDEPQFKISSLKTF